MSMPSLADLNCKGCIYRTGNNCTSDYQVVKYEGRRPSEKSD